MKQNFYKTKQASGFKKQLALMLLLALWWGSNAWAQTPELIKEFATSQPKGFITEPETVVKDGILYFWGQTPSSGMELWKTDGTDAGTVLIKDIFPGTRGCETGTKKFAVIGNEIYFYGTGDFIANSFGLWKTDGTKEGTVLVKNQVAIYDLIQIGNTIYFKGNDFEHGEELWKSDGTEAGTVMIKDITPGTAGSDIYYLCNINGTVYFCADDDTHGKELWKSDGTEAGTVMVKDIYSGSEGAYISGLYAFDDKLFFSARDASCDGLWMSDGTEAGTSLVKNINSISYGYDYIGSFFDANDKLYFRATDGSHGSELWTTDGTEAGTVMIKDINSGSSNSYPQYFILYDGEVYFSANGGTSNEIWTTDGTEGGTTKITSATSMYPPVIYNGKMYFSGYTADKGFELWESDGTDVGTKLVKDINPGSVRSINYNTTFYTILNGDLLFKADDGIHGEEIWKTDGTEGGTQLFKNTVEDKMVYRFSESKKFNNDIYFTLSYYDLGMESQSFLCKTDGTTGGTIELFNKNPGEFSNVSQLEIMDGNLYFVANIYYDAGGFYQLLKSELYKTDGSVGGETKIKEFNNINSLCVCGSTLFFAGTTDDNGAELWKTDGTPGGTVMVKDIMAGTTSSYLSDIFNLDGTTVVFKAPNGDLNNKELWKSDGTEAGTVLVKEISSTTNGIRKEFCVVDGVFYFEGQDDTHGPGLWKSDGTEAGTIMVKDINPNTSNFIYTGEEPFLVNNKLYFKAHNGTNYQVWRSDGTEAGTVKLTDFPDGTFDAGTQYDVAASDAYFFFGAKNTTTNEIELYAIDGTNDAVEKIKTLDITLGNTLKKDDFLVFSARDEFGDEPWKSDGTSDGTEMIYNLEPNGSSLPIPIGLIDDYALFYASTEQYPSSLYKVIIISGPSIKVNGTPANFVKRTGEPSASQTVKVSGKNLEADISVNAPTGFEISTDGTTWQSTLTLTQTDGEVVETDLQIRMTAAATGNPTGKLSFTSTNAETVEFDLNGSVDDTPPTYSVAYKKAGNPVTLVKQGDVVTVTVTFSEDIAETPLPKIALAGDAGFAATNMTRTDATTFTYNWTVGTGTGTLTPEVTIGTDLAGNIVTNTGSTRTTIDVDNTPPTYVVTYEVGGVEKTRINTTVAAVVKVAFSEDIDNATTPKISLTKQSGTPVEVAATNMTKVNATTFTYNYAGSAGEGFLVPEVTTAQDLIGHEVTNTGSTQTILRISDASLFVEQDGKDIVPATGSFDFGTVTLQQSLEKTFTIINADGTVVNVSGITNSGTNSGDFTISEVPSTVPANGNTTFKIKFEPATDGARTATITINSDAAGLHTFTFTVNGTGEKIAQTIENFNAITMTYGDADLLPGASATSGLEVSYTSSDPLIASITAGKIHIVKAGTCNITASQAGNSLYQAAAPVEVLLTINKASQTISGFDAIATKTYGDDPFNVSATGGNSGNPVVFTSTDPAIATCTGTNGTTITIIKAGTCQIKANQAGNDNYSAAIEVTQTLTINKANQVITFDEIPVKILDDPDFELVVTGGTSGKPVTFTNSDDNVATLNGNIVTLKNCGTTIITASQAGNDNYNAANDVQRTLTVKIPYIWDGNVWIPPIPSTDKDRLIRGDYKEITGFVCEGDLTIENGVTLQIAPDASIPVEGKLVNNGTIVCKSSDDGAATGLILVKNEITNNGKIIFERYLSAPLSFHFVSSPVTNETTGIFDKSADVSRLITKTQYGITAQFYESYENSVMQPAHAYSVYNHYYGYTAQFVAESGESFNSGNFDITCNNALNLTPSITIIGQTLIGNPYPATIDFGLLNHNGMFNSCYICNGRHNVYWNETNGVGIGGGNMPAPTNGLIAPSQGFIMFTDELSGINSVQFTEDAIVTNTNGAYYKDKRFVDNILRLKVSNENEAYNAETVVLLREDASFGFDKQHDINAVIQSSESVSYLYTKTPDDQQMVLNAIPIPEEETSVPLGFITDNYGSYTISASEFEFSAQVDIILEDLLTGANVNISENSYSFKQSNENESDRFIIHFKTEGATNISTVEKQYQIYAFAKSVYIKASDINKNETVCIYNILGEKIIEREIIGSLTKIDLNVVSGTYFVRINTENNQFIEKVYIAE